MDLDHHGLMPITRAQAIADGLTAWQWRKVVTSESLVKVRRGVYLREVPAEDHTRYCQRVAAELTGRTNHLACSGSAVALLGLPNPYLTWWSRIPVTIAGPRSDPRITARRNDGWPPMSTPWGPATDGPTTAAVIAAELPLPQALIVTDAVARHLAGTTDRYALAGRDCRERVRRMLTDYGDFPALRLADPAAESPGESYARGHLLLAGFPEPRCGVPHTGRSGKQYFLDMLLDGLAIEIDGRMKYRTVQDLVDEKRREDDLRATGLRFHRELVENLYADPDRLVQDVSAHRLPLPA